MDILEKEKIDIFVKNYFKSLRTKLFLIYSLFYFMYMNLIDGIEEISFILIIAVIITPLVIFLRPDHLRKETEKAIRNFYNRTLEYDDKLIIICNLRKLNGPTFGTLHIDENTIEFKPFRDNLQNESFLIKREEMKNINFSLSKINSSIFFKELNKSITISYDSRKVVLQIPEPEKTIEKICA